MDGQPRFNRLIFPIAVACVGVACLAVLAEIDQLLFVFAETAAPHVAIDNPAWNAAIDDWQPVRLIMEIAFQINEGKADLAFFACFRQCDFKAKIRDGLAVCFWNRET